MTLAVLGGHGRRELLCLEDTASVCRNIPENRE